MMFIPAGVGLMVEWDSLREILVPFAVIIVVTTVLVMAVTGRATQWMIRREGKGNRRKDTGKS